VTICPPQLGQKAALWGLRNLADWLAAERAEILRRRATAHTVLSALPGWRVLGCGAYFAYVEHPHPLPSDALCPVLVRDLSLLMLPGTMFAPSPTEGGEGRAERQLRMAFANVSAEGLRTLGQRLAVLGAVVA
jgi:aspartate/methionine/tyrosine aminotransferase